MNEQETVIAEIEEIIYHNEENGYTVLTAETDGGEMITAVGYMPAASEGTNVKLLGTWINHPDYGEQFKFLVYEIILPTEAETIYRYLASGIVYGVRAATARKIVDLFGDDTLKIMLSEPDRLAEVKGISKDRAKKIGASFLELQSMQNIVMYLQQYNISANTAVKVYNKLGSRAVESIKENPYILCDKVDGISFRTADSIAAAQGRPHNSRERICSGLRFVLKSASYIEGHTFIPAGILQQRGEYILNVTAEEISNVISELMLSKDIVSDTVGGCDVFYLSALYNAECYTAQRLSDISGLEPKQLMPADAAEEKIREAEAEEGITLAAEQREAVMAAISQGCIVLTGGPGTGKTTTINTIIKILDSCGLKLALAAPTGRAAKRMSELTGREAKTIHRLLGATGGTEEGRFSRNETNPLSADVVILDEVSMIDITLMYHFLRALRPGAKLILSGDADQLPSVGAGNVLHDIISSGIVPVIRLSHIFRQAEQSLIIVNAHRINSGELPVLDDHKNDFFFLRRTTQEDIVATILDLYCSRLPKSYGYDPLSQIQVLTPTRKGMAGVNNLNHIMQNHINPADMTKAEYTYGDTVFRVGDKVMQIRNNYDMYYERENGEDGLGIYNGDMGIILSISSVDKLMVILFDDDKRVEYPLSSLDELVLAYAVTVHKSQGSEFPAVIMPVCSFPPMLMCRNLFYTAVTRARSIVILVGNEAAVRTMTENNRESERYTGLAEKINRYRESSDVFKTD